MHCISNHDNVNVFYDLEIADLTLFLCCLITVHYKIFSSSPYSFKVIYYVNIIIGFRRPE